jgi:hypothetical protein
VRKDDNQRTINIYINTIDGANEKQVLLQPVNSDKIVREPRWNANNKIFFLATLQGEKFSKIYSVNLEEHRISNLRQALNH